MLCSLLQTMQDVNICQPTHRRVLLTVHTWGIDVLKETRDNGAGSLEGKYRRREQQGKQMRDRKIERNKKLNNKKTYLILYAKGAKKAEKDVVGQASEAAYTAECPAATPGPGVEAHPSHQKFRVIYSSIDAKLTASLLEGLQSREWVHKKNTLAVLAKVLKVRPQQHAGESLLPYLRIRMEAISVL